MKIIKTLFLSLILSVGLYAKDKDYGYAIKNSENLSVGTNVVKVNITKRNVKISNAKAKLVLFQSGQRVGVYHSKSVNKNREYLFEVNFDNSGEYRYVLSFNIGGGVVHKRRGELTIL